MLSRVALQSAVWEPNHFIGSACIQKAAGNPRRATCRLGCRPPDCLGQQLRAFTAAGHSFIALDVNSKSLQGVQATRCSRRRQPVGGSRRPCGAAHMPFTDPALVGRYGQAMANSSRHGCAVALPALVARLDQLWHHGAAQCVDLRVIMDIVADRRYKRPGT